MENMEAEKMKAEEAVSSFQNTLMPGIKNMMSSYNTLMEEAEEELHNHKTMRVDISAYEGFNDGSSDEESENSKKIKELD